MRRYVAQRQTLPFIAASICASVGFGVFARSAAADISWPAWQYPHCGPSSPSHAFCSGCEPSLDNPSMVVTSTPCSVETLRWHDRTVAPFTCTVHAPHWLIPQPNLVPLRSSVSRSTQRSGVSSATSTVVDLPLTLNVTVIRGRTPSSAGFRGARGVRRAAVSLPFNVALQGLGAYLGSIDIPLGVCGDALRGAGVGRVLVGVRDERRYRAVLRAADPDPAFPGSVRRAHRPRFGVGDVDPVVLVDVDPARPAEL